MKSILFSAIAFTLLFSSCKKKDSTTNTPTGSAATMTAENYGFDNASSGKFSSTAAGIVKTGSGTSAMFSVTGIKDGTKESITIILLKDITGTGIINVSPDLDNGGIVITKDYTQTGNLTYTYSTDNSGGGNKGGGRVEITSYDGTNVAGTFYAVCYNSAGSPAFAEQGKFSGKIN